MKRILFIIYALSFLFIVRQAFAQIQVNPTGVNVNKSGATTVFLTFGGLSNDSVGPGVWCGDIQPAENGIGMECVPGTIFGVLPQRSDFSNNSAFLSPDGTAFTDIMSIPASVARRAYQAAIRGSRSGFFYVRQFISNSGGPDQFVPVTCRMSAGGARSPLSLVNVRLVFETKDFPTEVVYGEEVAPLPRGLPSGEIAPYLLKSRDQSKPVIVSGDLVAYVKPGEKLPPVGAEIVYTGSGRLIGRWEVVLPGDEAPSNFDLLPEATLPAQRRGLQRRYTQLQRFNVFLPPVGKFTLPGPDVSFLPTEADGLHQVLLRIEPSDEKDSQSNLAGAGAGTGIVFAGGVAGFAIPPLRYYVLGGNVEKGIFTIISGRLQQIFPPENYILAPDKEINFTWSEIKDAALYRVQIEGPQKETILSAMLKPGIGIYRAPVWLRQRAGDGKLRWRVDAISYDGKTIEESGWRNMTLAKEVEPPLPESPDNQDSE